MLADYSEKLDSYSPTLIAGSTSQQLPAVRGKDSGNLGELVSHGSCFGYPMKTGDQTVK